MSTEPPSPPWSTTRMSVRPMAFRAVATSAELSPPGLPPFPAVAAWADVTRQKGPLALMTALSPSHAEAIGKVVRSHAGSHLIRAGHSAVPARDASPSAGRARRVGVGGHVPREAPDLRRRRLRRQVLA